ncbi:hypothetical protein CSB96_0009 [Pseudomonas aeruginosa]|nr:hypothetical protein CSB96_0009 [Pseudomonas aeruginosa]
MLDWRRRLDHQGKGLEEWVNDEFGLFALLGLVFVCGLPGWVLTRGFFAYAEYRKSGPAS